MLIRNSVHILIVDDDPLNVELVSSVTSAPDRKIYIAKTLGEALQTIKKQTITLVLLDLFLPDGDGRTFLRQLKESKLTYDIPIIVLTVNNNPTVRKECIDLGAVGFFTRPLQLPLLKEAIDEQLQLVNKESRTKEQTSKPLQSINLCSRPEIIEKFIELAKTSQTNHRELWLGITSVDNIDTLSSHVTEKLREKILQRLLLTIAVAVDENGYCCRWGESEFLTLFPDMPLQFVADLHQHIQTSAKGIIQETIPAAKSDKLNLCSGIAEVSGNETLDAGLIVTERFLLAARNSAGEKIVHSQLQTTFPDRKILIIDDDPVISGMIQFRLQREGFETVVAGNGVEGWTNAVNHEPDLITLDVKMPIMDGFELLKKLRNDVRFNKTPVLLLTTQGNEKDVTRGFELGASDYMIKPFSPTELLVRIRRLMMNSVASFS